MGHPTSGSALLALSPARRPMAVVVPAAAAGPVLMIAGEWIRISTVPHHTGPHRIGTVLVFLGLVLILACGRALLITTRGMTEAWPDGLYNRLGGPRAEVTWEQVDKLEVVPRLTGRVVQVVNRDGSRITLAAPRIGLFAQATSFDQSLRDLCAAPGGHRPPLPAEYRHWDLIVLQGVTLLTITAIVIYMALR